ncbi:MAG: hypothetical protein N3G19_01925 [Candidatus Pacearchaeota archaeon]|nr:hypothetical protein [Candidatus Pacearchaeota archaeon]
MEEYEIGDIIKINYKNHIVDAKILDVKQIEEEYKICLLINKKEIPFSIKELGLKVLDLDEIGIKLIKN